MADIADLIVLVADPAGFGAEVFSKTHEAVLSELLRNALIHYMRDPGWFAITFKENRFYACQLVTIPLLAYIKHRVPARQLKEAAERLLTQTGHFSDPAAWIMVSADFLTPLPHPEVNVWHAQKLKNSLEKAVFIDPLEITEPEIKAAPDSKKNKAPVKKENPSQNAAKKKASPDADKIIERVMLGWRVSDICKEQNCSESYVYKLIKKHKGSSAMDYRWNQWELIARIYHSRPKKTISEIEKACGVSRSVIYHAVKKIANRDGKDISRRELERKLTPEDVKSIKIKLSQGVLRKHIMAEYNITNATLIKYVGTHEDYKTVSDELKEYAVRLRVQGKTLQETADIIGVTVATVKRAWSKKKDSHDIKEKRVKYDNRNVLSKRDRDQAVNAVLRDGHTRKQIYTQYGINALTLRRYIREAQKREIEALKEQDNRLDENEDQ
ncbi:hypothetical protein BBB56_23160 [Candidatus Pantoea deserta]|uniref:Helix-turn-helix domain-containing protein n=1 Tax=Candidatus Pantoea deserta TaxID=1869313 RepID=A0A3N4NE88_9GAMM|nr:hypothetical protein [Pantoea deserta]RPD91736.1 hypothetical protein BBB56_23160 [Pantoea deserta]